MDELDFFTLVWPEYTILLKRLNEEELKVNAVRGTHTSPP